MRLSDLSPLFFLDTAFVSVQKEVREDDAEWLASQPKLRHYSGQLRDFADTAAMISCLDLVITVDTSVTHLTGAMGRPVWILLCSNPDWRWLRDREDSPWYPTARLFRQDVIGQWRGVVERVSRTLAAWAASHQRPAG